MIPILCQDFSLYLTATHIQIILIVSGNGKCCIFFFLSSHFHFLPPNHIFYQTGVTKLTKSNQIMKLLLEGSATKGATWSSLQLIECQHLELVYTSGLQLNKLWETKHQSCINISGHCVCSLKISKILNIVTIPSHCF